ncbi:CHAT domain-containing protein [Agromyces sp. Marseille-P2726]|uniref:CHAT domain-containing protein n=1 Tax=Agromyces sp. Marseille-P2726 TaxID=2709132 RepID=UPI00156EF4EF|nr:CHAT domain-containing protein [Agromyces sp. Marseille-P2726]
MTARDDRIEARGPLRVEPGLPDEAWIPPVGGAELARASVVGTGEGTPVLMFFMPDDVDPRRVVVFVRVGTLLCSLAPTRAGDRYEVELPFNLGSRTALVVVLECRSEADATELVKRYDASRVRLDEEERAETGAEPPPEEAAAEPEPRRVPSRTRSIPPSMAPPPLEAAPVEAMPANGHEALAHVHAEMPKRVVVETPVEVRFRLSRRRLAASEGSSHTEQSIRVDTDRDVTVTIALRGFRLADGEADTVAVRLPDSADAVAEHRFTIVAPRTGKGEVSLAVRQNADLPIATLRITSDIVAAGARDDEIEANEVDAEVVDPDPELVRLPSIRIDESIVGNDSTLRIRVTVAGITRECTKALPDKAAFIARTYRVVAGIRAELRDIRDVAERRRHGVRRLRDLGMGLARALFSTDVLDLLWEAAPGELEGLIVQTTGELDIPWEIVHLVPPSGADDGQERFLSGFGLTRWVYDTAHPTELHIEPARARYVCPMYVERRLHLTHAVEERRFMEDEFQATTVDPDDAGGIAALMHSGFDLLHFAGHGRWSAVIPPAQELLLAGFREAVDVPGARYSDGELRNDLPDVGAADAAATGPFVFLNACDIGRLPSGPAALGGFPEAFLRGGAAAFVGCSWAVGDDPASAFVEGFYRALAAPGTTIADATRIARLAARKEADLSEHAYAVYAHPHAHVFVDRPTPEGPGS